MDDRRIPEADAGSWQGHEAERAGERAVPLVVDLDGTLLRTDLLLECFWAALGRDAPAALRAAAGSWRRPACLKRRLREIAMPEAELLPVNAEVAALMQQALDDGRPVHLASAADLALVEAVAERFALPGPHFGSVDPVNLKGERKARLLVERFGPGGFDYVGDSRADLPVWRAARKAYVASGSPALLRALGRTGKPVVRLSAPVAWSARMRALLREARPRQWVKNLLLLLPALAEHRLDAGTLGPVLPAMIAFGFGASSIYMVNDLLDLDADRSHPEKSRRPVASGELPIPVAMAGSVSLAALALVLALSVSPATAAMTGLYMAGSLSYSLWLKRRRWLDVLALAGLFLMRVLTGAVAAGLAVSAWLLGFVFFVFFTLACIKRLTELARTLRRGYLPGRGYGARHFGLLKGVAWMSSALAAAVFAGYAFSPAAVARYESPHVLALAAVPVGVWLMRGVWLSSHGREDYDPLRFVARDVAGMVIAASGLALVIAAL